MDRHQTGGDGGAGGAEEGAAPGWASFFASAAHYERFERVVRQFFLDRGERVLIEEEQVRGSSLGEVSLGLMNVGQVCAQHEEGEWPRLVADHLSAVLRSFEEGAAAEEPLEFEACRGQLVVRLYEAEDIARILDVAVVREDVPGLMSILCLDLPTSVQTLRRDQVEPWGKSDDELFAQAAANTAALIDVELQQVEVEEGVALWLASGDSVFNSAVLLMLERYLQFAGRHGMFVSAPTRHAVLVLPFDSLDAMHAIGHLMHLTGRFEEDGPGSLSTRVWWHKDGRWIDLPWEMTEDGISVNPPEAFTEVLQGMGFDLGGEEE
jgi:hypothetical protein